MRSRVGIATGVALASPTEIVGGPSAIAAAVCAVAPPDAVLVTASTHRRLSDAFVCDQLEQYLLAGLYVPVTACRVTGNARSRAVSGRPAQESCGIGRPRVTSLSSSSGFGNKPTAATGRLRSFPANRASANRIFANFCWSNLPGRDTWPYAINALHIM